MARVPYRDPDDLPEAYRHLIHAPYADEPAVNVFRAIANNPPVLESFRKYFGVLWTEAGLTTRERELVVLATARGTDSAYMWHQHVQLAREAGIADDEIRSVGAREYGRLPGREPLLLRYADAVVEDRVDDAIAGAVAEAFEPATVVGIAMLSAGYVAVARALSALDVGVEGDFVGWDLRGD